MSEKICNKCGKKINSGAIYRVYVKKLLPYARNVKPLKTIDFCYRCYNQLITKPKPEKIEKHTFIFNPIKGTLRDKDWNHTYELSEMENKLISVLSNGRMNSWADLNNYIYPDGYTYNRNKFAAGNIKNRLMEKIPLNIRIVKKGGLILDDKILIES